MKEGGREHKGTFKYIWGRDETERKENGEWEVETARATFRIGKAKVIIGKES